MLQQKIDFRQRQKKLSYKSKTFRVIRLSDFFTRFILSIVGIVVSILILSYRVIDSWVDGIMSSLFFLMPLLCWYNANTSAIADKLTISREGVEYQKRGCRHFLTWDEINFISIDGSIYRRVIYFNGGEFEQQFSVKRFRDFHATYFGAVLRLRMIEEIQKYWDKPIEGIYQVIGRSRF